MNSLELRPLSIGDILDRTFTLYRNHFLLFVALAGIPRLPALAFGLVGIITPIAQKASKSDRVVRDWRP